MEIIKRGAEAVLYRDNDSVIKERIKKGYRIEEIDKKLRKDRTRKEARLILEARRCGVNVPNIEKSDESACRITMELIEGDRIKEYLFSADEVEMKKIATVMGEAVGRLHSNGIVHGDLTTSNMILKGGKLYLIDFGLGGFSSKPEDQGTDLAVLKEAFKSTHFKQEKLLWQSFIKAYAQSNRNSSRVLEVLEDIERRGRYINRE